MEDHRGGGLTGIRGPGSEVLVTSAPVKAKDTCAFRTILFLAVLTFILAGSISLSPRQAGASAGKRHKVYFPNTPYCLNVYRIYGREPGPTLMIIGGIQGNEPGGFLAADRYVDLTLRKGNLIVVPRANFYSILKNQRGPDGDMNRRFRDAPPRNYVDRIVEILKSLMREADYLLNLHDGSGYFSPKWEGPRRNPMRYGQSIIVDAESYVVPGTGRVLRLGDLAKRVIQRVNPQIHNGRHHFRFNNHRTMAKDTLHPEQRTSATFYALTRFGTPAFGIETSKDIPDYRVRVQYQTMVINAFLEELGIIPDNPPIPFDPPQLQYVLISVNGALPVAVPDKGSLTIKAGDAIRVESVVANYQRGITADVQGWGSENDFHRIIRPGRDTKILVRKESQVFGYVSLKVKRGPVKAAMPALVKSPLVKYFMVEVNGQGVLVENHGTLPIVRGDYLKILDVVTEGISPLDLKVNFIGFVGDEKGNEGEDRGYLIRTARDLWKRYALDRKGSRYRIAALRGKELLGEMVVELQRPRLLYLVVQMDGGTPLCYKGGSVITVRPGGKVKVVDVRTNVNRNIGVDLVVRGGARKAEHSDHTMTIEFLKGDRRPGEILVTREGLPMGVVRLKPRK